MAARGSVYWPLERILLRTYDRAPEDFETLLGMEGVGGHPFPVDLATYERTIAYLRRALDRSRVDRSEKVSALKRLAAFAPPATRARA